MTNEKLIAIGDLPAVLQKHGAKRVSKSTVWRWVTSGVRGRRLRVLRIGGSVYTTWQWVMELSEDSEPQSPPVAAVTGMSEAAEAFLDGEFE